MCSKQLAICAQWLIGGNTKRANTYADFFCSTVCVTPLDSVVSVLNWQCFLKDMHEKSDVVLWSFVPVPKAIKQLNPSSTLWLVISSPGDRIESDDRCFSNLVARESASHKRSVF